MKLGKPLASLIGLISSLCATPSFAHHVMDGGVPTNAFQGLLSGLAHPVIGIDHLAFLVVMGIAATYTSRPLLSPLAFIASTVGGCLLVTSGIQLPWIEIGVTVSVIAVGLMVSSGRQYPPISYIGLFALAGVLHGGAYAAAIVGAEVNSLVAYLVGFAFVQFLISIVVGRLANRAVKQASYSALNPRLAAAGATGAGVALFVGILEGALF